MPVIPRKRRSIIIKSKKCGWEMDSRLRGDDRGDLF